MALVSPGVQVNVIDESFYTPSAAGTVPMIFVASASNKTSSSGAGVAVGTLAANAGKPYLITSQRELGETFGDPLFYSDNNGNMIHGGELNEYGLQAAYSVLGVTNRAYVVRADLDLSKLEASATAPAGEPAAGANWFDTQVSAFGILEWNNAPVTTTGGQSFSTVARTVLVEASDIDSVTSAPKTAIGAIGDYAVDASFTDNRVFYKSTGNTAAGVVAGEWVQVGSEDWKAGLAAVRGTISNPVLSNGDSITINGTQVVLAGTTITALATDINGSGIAGITAAAVNGALEIYSTGVDVVLTRNIGGLLADSVPSSDTGALGITEGTYSAPRVAIAPHTQVPEYKLTDAAPAPSGSIWVKTTTPNGGANFSVKQYNADTQLWGTLSAPVYATAEGALRGLDASGGGANLVAGDVYIKSNINELASAVVDYKIYSRVSSGATSISSARITTQLAAAAYTFDLAETVVGSTTRVNKTVSVTTTGAITDADVVAGAINSTGFTNIVALVDASNKIVIQHKLGGDIRIADTVGFLALAGFATSGNGATANLYDAPTGDAVNDWVASNWKPMTYTASADAPASLTAAGELWYNSIVDEVDMLVHDGATWTGYRNVYPDTNAAGPIVAATEPTVQTDNVTNLVNGDIWIDTADVENYPTIYRYNPTIAATGASGWILVDKADQTTDNGVLFADARWSAAGSSSAEATIEVLLESDYLDPDAPDPALYPKGMLLWNLRRSGFNVKRFVRNYIDVTADNGRYQVIGLSGSDEDESMTLYYPHRWVTDSGNNEDGSGTFGRHAQRKSVVQALQALVNSNQEIRDEESRQFNLMAAPGYPELIGEMITLNYDRRLTAFVIGDTPARLTPDATSLNEWASNVNLAVEDNDDGAVSYDEYMAMYYPWGFTSDNAGNNVVVPPSHMALRTLVLNDQVAFPWFAPAGTRRGGVTNASASGYITSEGEFQSVALNTGQRDILYSNNINPITFISGAGLVVFGQKTRARNASALDRVNVARLVVYLRGQLELLARPYLFEPNDKITRDQVKAAADSLLLELVALRALYDFLVVCDESNNTPARIDRNELYLDIAIEPVKAIEFIYIPLRIKNTGEIAALG
jgi:hypothetical protein